MHTARLLTEQVGSFTVPRFTAPPFHNTPSCNHLLFTAPPKDGTPAKEAPPTRDGTPPKDDTSC